MPLGNYTGERLARLFDRRWGNFGDWRNRWEEISFYVLPQQRSFSTDWSMGNDRNENRIMDSTALEANERLATRMHEALTSPASVWFRLGFNDTGLNERDDAREWLEECERRIRLALAQSNFDTIMGQMYLDLGALGTAAITLDEQAPPYGQVPALDQFYGFHFRQLHLGETVFTEDANCRIVDIMTRLTLTAEQICQRWGDAAPKKAKDAVESGDPDKECKVLMCRFARDLRSPPPNDNAPPKEREYATVWVDYSGDKAIIEDDGTYEQSAYVARWRMRSQDPAGYGPGQRALPTIRTINEAERLELSAWAKVIDPPIKSTANNVVGDLDIRAKGITVVRKLDDTQQWDIAPDLNHHMIQLEDKRYQVREIFRYHSLELPPREQVGEMTAYEVAKRVEQVYRALGPTVVQLQADVLNPMMKRAFSIMYRKGALPEAPESVLEAGLNVQYVGPMAIAQHATEIEALDRFTADALALAQQGFADALDIVDFDKAQRYKATLLGVPAVALRSAEEVEQIRAVRAEAQAAQAAREAALNQSEYLKNMGDAVGQEAVAGAVEGMGEDALAGTGD